MEKREKVRKIEESRMKNKIKEEQIEELRGANWRRIEKKKRTKL